MFISCLGLVYRKLYDVCNWDIRLFLIPPKSCGGMTCICHSCNCRNLNQYSLVENGEKRDHLLFIGESLFPSLGKMTCLAVDKILGNEINFLQFS